MLARHGYGVLLFDRRGEGESEGDPNVFGWGGERDLLAAAAYLRSRADIDGSRIGAIGLSVGGEMLIHAAAHSRRIRSDCHRRCKRTVAAGRAGQPRTGGTTPRPPAAAEPDRAVAVLAYELPPPSLKSEVARIAPTPVFFIYGEHGQGGTETRPNNAFYAAAHEPKQIWEVPRGPHTAGITTRPAEYEHRVLAFFDRALLPTD